MLIRANETCFLFKGVQFLLLGPLLIPEHHICYLGRHEKRDLTDILISLNCQTLLLGGVASKFAYVRVGICPAW